MIICAICKKGIKTLEPCIELDGKFVHTKHEGVIQAAVGPNPLLPEDIMFGCTLALRHIPACSLRKYRKTSH